MKYLIIPVLFLLTLMLLGCTNIPFLPPSPEIPEPPITPPPLVPDTIPPVPDTNVPVSQEIPQCYSGNYSITSTACESLTVQITKDKCYLDLAMLKENPFYCEQINDNFQKQNCYLEVGDPKELPPCEPETEAPEIETLPLEVQNIILECAATPQGSQRDDCLRDSAVDENLSVLCEFVTTMSKGDCYNSTAISNEDVELCKKISDTSVKNSCLYKIGTTAYIKEACSAMVQTGKESIEKRDDCLNKVAVNNLDFEICELMSASYLVNTYPRDDCYYSVFSETDNNALCYKILEESKKDDCLVESGQVSVLESIGECRNYYSDQNLTECITEIALTDSNHLLCKEIADSNSRRYCYNSFVSEFTTDSTDAVCNSMTFTDDRDNCFDSLASETNDGNYCIKISNDSHKANVCLKNAGIANNDVSLCSMIVITDPQPWDDCFYEIATSINDANLCVQIKSQETMFDCVYEVAVSLGSLSICDVFPQSYYLSYSKYKIAHLCYKNYSIEKDDIFICDSIPDYNLNQACIDQNADFR